MCCPSILNKIVMSILNKTVMSLFSKIFSHLLIGIMSMGNFLNEQGFEADKIKIYPALLWVDY